MKHFITFKAVETYSDRLGYRVIISNKFDRYIVKTEKDPSKIPIDRVVEIATKKLKEEGFNIIGYSSGLLSTCIIICE